MPIVATAVGSARFPDWLKLCIGQMFLGRVLHTSIRTQVVGLCDRSEMKDHIYPQRYA